VHYLISSVGCLQGLGLGSTVGREHEETVKMTEVERKKIDLEVFWK
jgi:hypothetical protein